jgi:hypothetical protein
MPKYTVTIQGDTGNPKTVIVDTDGMSATVVQPEADAQTSVIQGGKHSAPSFRLKKRRITRKLKKTR